MYMLEAKSHPSGRKVLGARRNAHTALEVILRVCENLQATFMHVDQASKSVCVGVARQQIGNAYMFCKKNNQKIIIVFLTCRQTVHSMINICSQASGTRLLHSCVESMA